MPTDRRPLEHAADCGGGRSDYRVSRERQDLFGAESQRRAAAGKLAGESAPFRA